ncbi:hypothetical protein Trydic_g15800 [Trypoxylus dichotomus]
MDSFNSKVWLLNERMMTIDPRKDITGYPRVHIGLNPCVISMRQELHNLHHLNTAGRKQRLLELYKQDYLREEKELREVDIFANRGEKLMCTSLKSQRKHNVEDPTPAAFTAPRDIDIKSERIDGIHYQSEKRSPVI